jgi:hypothetical protein
MAMAAWLSLKMGVGEAWGNPTSSKNCLSVEVNLLATVKVLYSPSAVDNDNVFSRHTEE